MIDATISPIWAPPPAIVCRADGLAVPPALAMLMATQLVGFGSGGADAPPAAAVFTANSSNTVASSTYNFTSQSFGTASADRSIVVGAAGQSGGGAAAITSLSIGGVSASQLLVASETSNAIEFWIAAVPTGSSGTVTVDWAAQRARCAIAVWAVTGLLSSAVSDSAQESGFGSTPGNGTVNVPAGGVVLGMTYDGGTGGRTWSWSGLTEGVDASFGGGRSYSAANADFATAEAGSAVSATPSGNTTGGLFAALVLR
jgi:hypothetical protein